MQSIDSLTEVFNSLELKLSKYERAIHTLTFRISVHQKRKSRIAGDGPLYALHRKKLYEWRRISYALHRKRSELKAEKNMLINCIEAS